MNKYKQSRSTKMIAFGVPVAFGPVNLMQSRPFLCILGRIIAHVLTF